LTEFFCPGETLNKTSFGLEALPLLIFLVDAHFFRVTQVFAFRVFRNAVAILAPS
jgi:hypothetical protein